mgnify:CR=1 FL=1
MRLTKSAFDYKIIIPWKSKNLKNFKKVIIFILLNIFFMKVIFDNIRHSDNQEMRATHSLCYRAGQNRPQFIIQGAFSPLGNYTF